MTTLQESALNAKFYLCFKLELVSIADILQDFGQRELPGTTMDGIFPFVLMLILQTSKGTPNKPE